MTDKPCPRDHAALTPWTCQKCTNQTALPGEFGFCPGCGTARPEPPAEMTDERLALEIEKAGDAAIGWSQHTGYSGRDSARKWGLAALAKARELLARPAKLPSVESLLRELAAHAEEMGVACEDAKDKGGAEMCSYFAEWAKLRLSAPPAQPEKLPDRAAVVAALNAARERVPFSVVRSEEIADVVLGALAATTSSASELAEIRELAVRSFTPNMRELLPERLDHLLFPGCEWNAPNEPAAPAQPEPKVEPPKCSACDGRRWVLAGNPLTSHQEPCPLCNNPIALASTLGPPEPPAPATSAETRWSPDVGSDGRACMVVSRTGAYVAAADLASATKALQEELGRWKTAYAETYTDRHDLRAKLGEAERNHLQTKATLEAGLWEVLNTDEVYPVAETAIRILREKKAEVERQRDEMQILLGRAEIAERDLAALRASQPAGLPGIGETVEVLMASPAGSQWHKVVVSRHGREFTGPTFYFWQPLHGPFFLADEGKTWRRLSTGEKGRG